MTEKKKVSKKKTTKKKLAKKKSNKKKKEEASQAVKGLKFFGIWILLPLLLLSALFMAASFLWDFSAIGVLRKHRIWVISGLTVWVIAWVSQGLNEGLWRFMKFLRRPPLLKWFLVTLIFVGGMAACEFAYGLSVESFVLQDKTPISLFILGIAMLVILENGYQAFVLAYRIRFFRQLHDIAVKEGQKGYRKVIKRAKESSNLVAKYIGDVELTGGNKKKPSQAVLILTLEEELHKCASWAQMMVLFLPALGLLGTIVGIKIGMAGMGDAASGGAAGFAEGVGVFLSGMNTALNTTLIGAIFGGLYFFLSSSILQGGASNLHCEITNFVQIFVVNRKSVQANGLAAEEKS